MTHVLCLVRHVKISSVEKAYLSVNYKNLEILVSKTNIFPYTHLVM